MKKHYYLLFCSLFVLSSIVHSHAQNSVSFSSSTLSGAVISNPTSLQFGPDERLYVAQQDGTLKVFTVQKNGKDDYKVTATETILLIKNIPNHNDDGVLNPSVTSRQITGILVTGTASNPVVFVSSSDPRIGGGGTGGDLNLDTNSGIVSKLTWNGSSWSKIDVVIGLPRSEENHSVNGMQLDEVTNTLYLAVGGHTNAGAPSNNFAFLTEFALAAAILKIDLTKIQNEFGGSYFLPTLDDPTRPNSGPGGSDVNDPFGGNDGLNQAKLVIGGPVQIHSPGYRNAYDLVITKTPGKEGRMYTVDNGPNGGWGGHPDQEGAFGNPLTTNVTNNYVVGEPGSTGPGPNDGKVNNLDNLHLVSKPGMSPIYAGHPTPIRANPAGAGLYWFDNATGIAHFELNPTTDWPPVPLSLANPVEGDYRNPGVDDGALYTWGASTNGITEYTSDKFFNGAMLGDLLTASFDGSIYRIKLNEEGTAVQFVESLASGFGSIPLDVIAQGKGEVYEGTIWVVNYASNNITVFEPEGNWQAVTTIDNSVPIARHENSFIELNGKLYLIGGRETTTVNIYDPELKIWTTGGNLPFTMHHFQAVTWNGKIYIMGAYKGFFSTGNVNNSESPVDKIYSYDPATNQWTEGATIPRPRGSAGVVVYNNEFYLISGITNGHQDGWVNWVDKYNPVSNTWEELTGAPRERDHFHAVEMNGKIYLTGGRKTNLLGNVFGETIAEVDVYTIATDTWETLPASSNVITKRAGTSTVVLNNELYLIGGESTTQTISHNECEIFNPETKTWRVGPDLLVGRHGTGATVYNQSIYTAAGSANRGGGPALNSMESFVSASTCSGDDMNFDLDDDGDCYSNADETLNGTNPCSPSSKPNDFDQDCLSDLLDPDDDNDGIPDTEDPFAWDPFNGMNTTLPIFYPLLNGDPGFGFYGLGFTGLMTNKVSDYLTLFDAKNPDLIMGGAVGIATVPANSGSAKTNNQEYAFQFGVKVDPSNGLFTVKTKLQGTPFFNGIPVNQLQDQTQGIYIGNGDQQNYLKFALAANNGNPGLLVYGENNGTVFINQVTPVADILTTGIVYLNFEVDPVAASVQLYYQTATDPVRLTFGSPITLPSFFTNILAGEKALAVGIIASSGIGPEFSASWDFINITTSSPYVNEDAPKFYNRFVGNPTPPFTLNLNTVFDDDEGSDNLTYEIISVENNSFIDSYSVIDDLLTINFKNNELGSAKVIVKATDLDGFSVTYEFLIQVIPEPSAIVRINSGGNAFGSWSPDNYFSGGFLFSRVTPIANTTDDPLYQTERWGETITYQIPVPKTGYYRANLHFAEIYHGISTNQGIGARVFNVAAEGQTRLSNYDIFKEAGGAAIAIIEKIDSIYVSDGNLTLVFTTLIDNAKISAIEIAEYTVTPIQNVPPVAENPGDRYIYEGQSMTIQIIASDLNFGDVLTYSATGLPASLVINPATGLISGTIEVNANTFPVTVTVSDNKGGIAQVIFTINVVEPENYSFRINSGGSSQTYGTEFWSADVFFQDGRAVTFGAEIEQTDKDALYQTERSGTTVNYEIPMPGPGNYNVTLHFAELLWDSPGQRVFTASIENGQATLFEYDIIQKAGGANRPVTENFNINVTDGYLTISMVSVIHQAKISGIEISPCLRPSIESIAASASEICIGASTTLTVNGTLGEATAWHLYSGSCGGTLIASNSTGVFEVSPSATTTYFVRGEGGCTNEATCRSITITIKSVDTGVTMTGNTLTASANGATYQWINCNGNVNISGETAKTFTPQESGSYAVRVTQNGCTSVSSCVDIIIVGLRESLSDKIVAYPNPGRAMIRVSLPENSVNVKFEISDTRGKSVQQQYLNSGSEIDLDISGLTSGIYFIHVISAQYTKTIKIVVN